MIVHSWDEVSDEWTTHELAIKSRDPVEINRAFGATLVDPDSDSLEDDAPDGYEVESSSWAGPVLTIVTRNDRHIAVLVVIFDRGHEDTNTCSFCGNVTNSLNPEDPEGCETCWEVRRGIC